MSTQAVTKAIKYSGERRLSHAAARLLFVLSDLADEQYRCRPNLSQLAEACCMRKSNICRLLRELRAMGAVQESQNGSGPILTLVGPQSVIMVITERYHGDNDEALPTQHRYHDDNDGGQNPVNRYHDDNEAAPETQHRYHDDNDRYHGDNAEGENQVNRYHDDNDSKKNPPTPPYKEEKIIKLSKEKEKITTDQDPPERYHGDNGKEQRSDVIFDSFDPNEHLLADPHEKTRRWLEAKFVGLGGAIFKPLDFAPVDAVVEAVEKRKDFDLALIHKGMVAFFSNPKNRGKNFNYFSKFFQNGYLPSYTEAQASHEAIAPAPKAAPPPERCDKCRDTGGFLYQGKGVVRCNHSKEEIR